MGDYVQRGDVGSALAANRRLLAFELRSEPTYGGSGRFALSPDGQLLAAVSHQGGGARLAVGHWPVASGIEHAQGSVLGMVFSPDGELLAGIGGQTLRLWNRRSHLVRVFQPISLLTWVVFSPNGRLMASCVENRSWAKIRKKITRLRGRDFTVAKPQAPMEQHETLAHHHS